MAEPDIVVLSVETFERIMRSVSAVEAFRVTGDVQFHHGGKSISLHVRPGSPGDRFALVNLDAAGDAPGSYKASEVIWDAEAGTEGRHALKPGGRKWYGEEGTLPFVAELSGRVGLESSLSDLRSVVLIRMEVAADGAERWVFGAGSALSWAKVVSVSGSTITATPVADADGKPITPAPPNIVIRAIVPPGALDTDLVKANSVVAYITANGVHVGVSLPQKSGLPEGFGHGRHLQLSADNQPIWDYPRFMP